MFWKLYHFSTWKESSIPFYVTLLTWNVTPTKKEFMFSFENNVAKKMTKIPLSRHINNFYCHIYILFPLKEKSFFGIISTNSSFVIMEVVKIVTLDTIIRIQKDVKYRKGNQQKKQKSRIETIFEAYFFVFQHFCFIDIDVVFFITLPMYM